MADVQAAKDIDQLSINTIRTLAIDAVQAANSGHPGTPMSMAPVGYELFNHRLKYDPANAHWINRDRFVLSVGHASMLLYALLHLSGVQEIGHDGKKTGLPAVSLDDIRKFRQVGSKTPGHPESHLTTGVECTTGPLGQGVGNSVGMAIAERWLAAHYNRPGFDVFDHRVYALCGDGCMMEGISTEAASMAGHLRLSNLVWLYDSNRITIEGATSLAFDEDVAAKYLALGWNVLHLRDVNDAAQVRAVLDQVNLEKSRPTFVMMESVIGWGSPKKAGTRHAHGEALGVDEVVATKKVYGWPEDAQFLVPDGVMQHFAEGIGARGAAARAEWDAMFARYRAEYPVLAGEIDLIMRRGLPEGWDAALTEYPADPKGVATRVSSGKVLNALAEKIPYIVGGAADLAPSTMTNLTFGGAGDLEPENPGGRNMHFGIREHAMGAVCNGMAHSGLRSFGSGFLIFSDYMRTPIRLSALAELPVVWVFTHDSIGVGEDGPTHQPIEQLAGLRGMPGLHTIRPADANEVVEAWRIALTSTHVPVALVLSRQNLPTLDRTKYASAKGAQRGAYVLRDTDGAPDVILMATGSEVSLCVDVAEALHGEGVKARVVSMPCWDIFEKQDDAYRDEVLPRAVRARVAVEQAATLGWDRYAGIDGAIIGMHTFGASAPLKDLLKLYGFTPEKVIEAARAQIAKHVHVS